MMAALSGFPADASAWSRLGRGVFRGVVLVLVLVVAMMAGVPQDRLQDRFMAMPGGDMLALADDPAGHPAVTVVSGAAMADSDEGLDDAGWIVVPVLNGFRLTGRVGSDVSGFAESAAIVLLERPPRTIA